MWLKDRFALLQRDSLTLGLGYWRVRAAMAVAFLGVGIVLGAPGCGSAEETAASKTKARSCTALTGSPWVPNVPGVSNAHHSSSVSLSSTVLSSTGKVVGLGQGFSVGDEVSFTIDMNQDLGSQGSLTLMAMVTDYPSELSGGAFPYLVSIDDGTNKYINLTGNCLSSGFYTCSSGVCSVNSGCTLDPGAYPSRYEWELRQGATSGVNSPSVNIFPTCNWSGGTSGSSSDPVCPFVTTVSPATSPFFPSGSGKLRVGSYTAKYVILADSYSSLTNRNAGIKLTVQKKVSNQAIGTGAMDVNIILVGNTNIQASRTAKGQQNLNTLMAEFVTLFGQSNAGIKVGKVNAIEYDCLAGGDDFSALPVGDLGSLFAKSASLVPAADETKALNLFVVSSIEDDDTSSNLTILGIAGSLGGPLANGTAFSGVAVSSFDALDGYNPDCSSSLATCPSNKQESSFFQLGRTLVHEAGHYLNLQHLSESAGSKHDYLPDTPVCTKKPSGGSRITLTSCRGDNTEIFLPTGTTCSADCSPYSASSGVFCANKTSCQFNYIMWWTSQNFDPITGLSDGGIFSPNEGKVMNYHPIVQ